MNEFGLDRGQHQLMGEIDIAENYRRELIGKFEKGNVSAFQELLAHNLEQLQQQYQTIAAQEGNTGGLTTEVMEALFAGVQAQIADRKFAHWVGNTSAHVALQYLRETRTP